jgi:putative sugar O-methyltransferase
LSKPGATAGLGQVIEEMAAEVEEGPAIYRPSQYWEALVARNVVQLEGTGFETFKRTINQNYFNWLIARPWEPQFRSLVADWLRHPTASVAGARLPAGSSAEVGEERREYLDVSRRRIGYALFVAMLWEFARRRDRLGLLDRVDEPALGSPIVVRHRGRLVSQDLANSLLEVYSILEAFPDGIPEGATVVELGGGYGRLGWLLLSILPGLRYVAIDIPPALAVSQEYLTRLFPELPVARFRRKGEGLATATPRSRLVFVTPNQVEALPSLEADLFINVSSLHEMRREQISHYLKMVDEHTRGVFYTKQWRVWTNDRDGITIRQEDYPIPPAWKRIFERPAPVQTHFFEAAYRVG